jgi:hypothetical protein
MRNKIVKIVLENIKTKEKYKNIIRTLTINKLIIYSKI